MLKSRQRHEDTKSEDDISHQIIGAAIEVHRTLGGPGLLESIYESALSLCKGWCFKNNKRNLIDFLVSLSLRVSVFIWLKF